MRQRRGRLAVLSACLGPLLLVGACGDGEHQAAKQRERVLIAQIDSLRNQARMTRDLRDSLGAAIDTWETSVSCGLTEYDVRDLKRRGLSNPVFDLVADLEKHPEVLPANNPPGPWVYRPERSRIFILNTSWVYAVFSDGHGEKAALLRYVVDGPGQVRWQCLATGDL